MSKPFWSSEVLEKDLHDDWGVGGENFLCTEILGDYYDIPASAQKIRVHLFKKPAEGTGDVPLVVSSCERWEWIWEGENPLGEDRFYFPVGYILDRLYPKGGTHKFYVQIEVVE